MPYDSEGMPRRSVADVLGKDSEESSEDEMSYDYRSDAISGLKEIFSLDDAQADRLATIICGLAKEELEEDSKPSFMSSKKPAVKISVSEVLGKSPSKR